MQFSHILVICGRTLVAVTVRPSNGSWVLSKETPRVGLSVRVPAVAVVAQAPSRVLHDIVWKLCPLQTGGTRVRLGHGAVVVSQLCESLRAGQRHCTETGRGRRQSEYWGRWKNKMFWMKGVGGGFGSVRALWITRSEMGKEKWEEWVELLLFISHYPHVCISSEAYMDHFHMLSTATADSSLMHSTHWSMLNWWNFHNLKLPLLNIVVTRHFY